MSRCVNIPLIARTRRQITTLIMPLCRIGREPSCKSKTPPVLSAQRLRVVYSARWSGVLIRLVDKLQGTPRPTGRVEAEAYRLHVERGQVSFHASGTVFANSARLAGSWYRIARVFRSSAETAHASKYPARGGVRACRRAVRHSGAGHGPAVGDQAAISPDCSSMNPIASVPVKGSRHGAELAGSLSQLAWNTHVIEIQEASRDAFQKGCGQSGGFG